MADITTTAPTKDIEKLLAYLHEEEADYAAAHSIFPMEAAQHARAHPESGHIYSAITRVRDWIDAQVEPAPTA
jgi:hypothetical protein